MNREFRGKVAILLIGFNRPSFLEQRLKEVDRFASVGVDILVFVDGPRSDNDEDIEALEQITEIAAQYRAILRMEKINQGPDRHILNALNIAFSQYEGIIVIEDDVKICENGINSLLHLLFDKLQVKESFVGVSMSGIPLITRRMNFWRRTPYFCAWGYAINREFWDSHIRMSHSQECICNRKSLCQNSFFMNSLSLRKKNLWSERFNRGNYDYGFQLTMFKLNLLAHAPVFRIADNLGHSRQDASHTRYAPPIYLRFRVGNRVTSDKMNHINSKILFKLLTFVDSNTWAGDGILSSRGRTFGFRSTLKKILNRKS